MDDKMTSNSLEMDIRAFVAAVVLFMMIPPVYFWGAFNESFQYRFVLSILYLPCICSYYGTLEKKNGIPLLLFILLFVFYLRQDFFLAPAIAHIIFTSSLLLKPLFVKRMAFFFFRIFAILLIPSIIQYVLVSFFNISFPHKTIPPLDEIKTYVYQFYAFFVWEDLPLQLIPRYSAYFDEPGVLGSFCAIVLYCEQYNLKNKFNIPILIAGLLSFSFFFYIASTIYLLLFLKIDDNRKATQRSHVKIRKKTQKKKGTLLLVKIFIILLFVSVVFFLYYIDNEVINRLIFDRLLYDEDKGFSGNNRDVEAFRNWYPSFRFSSDYWLGLGGGASFELNHGGASYKNLIVDYGFVGFCLYLFLFIMFSRKSYCKNSSNFYIFCSIFIMMTYQRPFIMRVPYFQLLLFAAESIPERFLDYRGKSMLKKV